MATHYRMDSGKSRFTVKAVAAGLLSFMAHSPSFAVRDFTGEIDWQPGPGESACLDVVVRADSLQLVDNVSQSDRRDIESRMRKEVLQTDQYPEIQYHASEFSTVQNAHDRFQFQVVGQLALRGLTNRHEVRGELLLYSDGIGLNGAFPLRMSDYRIDTVKALGGSIYLQDQLQCSFEIVAWKEK